MAKTSGLGDNFYVAQYDLSGDVGEVHTVKGGNKPLDVTGINQSAHHRLGGIRDGSIEFTTYWNSAAGAAHPALSGLPTADVIMSYFRGAALGNDAASMVSKQLNYDPTRGTDGSLKIKVNAEANGFGLEWGSMLTAGLRTDTVATAGTGFDSGAASSFGGQLYLHVTAFAGTDVTVKLQDATTIGGSYADVTGGAFTVVSAAGSQRLALAANTTIRQFVKITTTTSAGFTSATFAVNLVKNATAVTF